MKTTSTTKIAILILTTLIGIMAFKPGANCSISGQVTDENKEGIPVASIVLLQQGKEVGGTTSDFDGNFCISELTDSVYDLKISYIGYEPFVQKGITIKDGKATGLHLQLKPASKTLNEVEITSYKVAQTRSYNCMSVSKISGVSLKGAYNKGSIAYDMAPAPRVPSYDLEEEPKHKTDDKQTTNDFDKITENDFLKAKDKPLSTFSIDVDVASYGMMRKQLEQGQMPDKESVRLEELINYFTYNYANPTDNKPFSVATEVGECPWNSNHQLVQVGVQGLRMDKTDLPPSNLVFLIDVSGSMQQADKLPLVQQSLRLLVNELSGKDKIAMVVYAGSSGLVLPATPCSQKETILKAINNLQAGGSTNGAAGINQAYEVAKKGFLSNGNNRVVLCTDGDFNVGVSSDADLTALIEKKREEGVFLSVLGFGMGNYKDSKMEKLADKGNGNYAYIDNLAEAKKNLVTQMGGTLLTIAKDVKIQVEFNPAMVKAYRLLGYENRALADKDFNDDKKDAGEIGAGASVTALYEIITNSNDATLKEIPETDALKYQKTNATNTAATGNEMLTIKIRYKEPTGTTSKLIEYPIIAGAKKLNETSDNFRFSAAVAAFGMLLRDSKYKGNFNYNKVRELATTAKGNDTEGYRAEFISLVNKTKSIATTQAVR